uniref:Mediator complex subunit 10 n=1 Tax=Strongyloides papillosus TaxID=174720 RepID=A0A0N5BJB5_STREA
MDTIGDKLDKILLELKDPTTREIVKMISSTMKLTDLPLELGDNEKYVKNKPFVEERIRQNLKMIELLSSQINDNLLQFITQDFTVTEPKVTKEDSYDYEDWPPETHQTYNGPTSIINLTEYNLDVEEIQKKLDEYVKKLMQKEPLKYAEIMKMMEELERKKISGKEWKRAQHQEKQESTKS